MCILEYIPNKNVEPKYPSFLPGAVQNMYDVFVLSLHYNKIDMYIIIHA